MGDIQPAEGGYDQRLSPRGPFTGSHMLNVKNARLRSEHDVQLLRNRLERLRQEERKALKKIEETRRRADQIVSLKTRNEENHMRKALEADYANKQMERARARLQGTREGQAEAIRQNAEMLRQQKKAEADVLRQQRELIKEHVSAQQNQHVARAQHINSVSAPATPPRLPSGVAHTQARWLMPCLLPLARSIFWRHPSAQPLNWRACVAGGGR